MKRVIFSEGKNDTIFLKELLVIKIGLNEKTIRFFDQCSTNTYGIRKPIEELEFEKLDNDWRRLEILAKSEGGKQKIIDVTTSMLPFLCQKNYDPIMLIDLDGHPIDNFTNGLKQKLFSKFKNQLKLSINHNELYTNNEITMCSIELLSDLNSIGKVYIIALKTSLEELIGIKKDQHYTDKEKKELSKKYIYKSNIHKLFSDALKA